MVSTSSTLSCVAHLRSPVKSFGHAARTCTRRATASEHEPNSELVARINPTFPETRQEKMPVYSVVVAVDVMELVAVVDVVAVVVCEVVVVAVVVGDVVAVVEVSVVVSDVDVVGVEVAVVVVVAVVVGLVVGVVTSQSWKPPRIHASAIAFIESATASQVSTDDVRPAPTQLTAMSSPSGPLNSVTAAASASAVSAQESLLCSSSTVFTRTLSTANAVAQEIVPLNSVGQISRTRIRIPA